MTYIKASVMKSGDGAGCATAKSSEIILVDVADIATEPTRSVGSVNMEGDFTLESSAKGVVIYATPSTIEITEEHSGEIDAKGVKNGLVFEHPGDSIAIKNFSEAFMNKGVVAFVKECDGSSTGRVRAVGSKCNPLYLSQETTINKEATKRKFTFKQEQNDKFLAGEYSGAEVPVAEAATTNQEGA